MARYGLLHLDDKGRQLLHQTTDKPDPKRDEPRHIGRREGATEERKGGDHHRLNVGEPEGAQQLQVDRASTQEQGHRERSRHQQQLHRQRHGDAAELAEEVGSPIDGLGEHIVERLALDLLEDRGDAQEDGDDVAEDVDGEEADVEQEPAVLVHRGRAKHHRKQDQQDGKEEDGVEDLVPHRLPEGVERDGRSGLHGASFRAASRRKISSSRCRCGATEMTEPPAVSTACRKPSSEASGASR